MREKLSPAIPHEDAYSFKIGDLLVSFHYIYVITERDEGKENEVPVVMATGFYQWNDGHVEWESTTWAEALMRADLVIM